MIAFKWTTATYSDHESIHCVLQTHSDVQFLCLLSKFPTCLDSLIFSFESAVSWGLGILVYEKIQDSQ